MNSNELSSKEHFILFLESLSEDHLYLNIMWWAGMLESWFFFFSYIEAFFPFFQCFCGYLYLTSLQTGAILAILVWLYIAHIDFVV